MAPSTEITPAWGSYVDLAQDVKPYLQIPSTDLARDRQLELIVDMCCTWVQTYLGRPVAPTEFFRRFSGTNVSYISLPYYPVLGPPDYALTVVEWWGTSGRRTDNCTTTSGSATVTDTAIQAADVGSSVVGPGVPAATTIVAVTPGVSFTMSANATATGAVQLVIAQGHVLVEQTPANQGTQDVYQMDYLRGTIIRSFMGLIQRQFFPGSRNVEVTWWAGYNPVPKDLMVATLELVAYWWRNTQQASRSGPRPRGMEGEYDSENPASSGLWPAVPHRVVALLEPYVQIAVG